MADIRFTNDAIDDLRRLGPEVVPRVLKKILLLETNVVAGYPLGGELAGFRKLVVGNNTWRIVYRVNADVIEICEIWAVGARADAEVYAEASARVRAAAVTRPELTALGDVIERLGRQAEGIAGFPPPSPPEPVPDWLATRLIHTVRLPREEVAAMDLQQAVDAWAKFTAGG
ncbi:type II toxin-antitoxin system RelE family toxin [Hamadaea tsunoensis]|uniref:type II toxin-antitoxin system RelE family toxin n=1 Tax=Hamadaea tsunoensis TaxID=53368 RepID=UPI0004249619|nr:type II toxin-antitoxin system RelE/ParE family toxin [Hamadaea tsunoensis]